MAAPELAADVSRRRQRAHRTPILLVEDDFSIRRTMAEVLADEGYEVKCAADGREALSILEEHGLRPGLIILDLWMPSMDGLKFRSLQKSLKSLSEIPVLVVTASRFLPRELKDLGLTHVLRKPLHLDELITTTRRLMHERGRA